MSGFGGAFVLAAALLVGCGGDGGGERPEHTAEPDSGGSGMHVTSAAFENGGAIPDRFTCDGLDVSPPLSIGDVPAGAVSLALVVDDPDAPRGTWDHWIAFDIDVTDEIAEDVGSLGVGGVNSWGRTGYGGPCPPGGTHRYFFTVYALDTRLGLAGGSDKMALLDAMEGRVLAEATLMGTYRRP